MIVDEQFRWKSALTGRTSQTAVTVDHSQSRAHHGLKGKEQEEEAEPRPVW